MLRVRSAGVYFGLFFIGGVVGAALYNSRVGDANSLPGLVVSVVFGLASLLIISSFIEVRDRIGLKTPGFYGMIKILSGLFMLSPTLSLLKVLPLSWATYLMFGSLLAMGVLMLVLGPYVAARRFRK